MARIDDDPEARDQETVKVNQILECPSCGAEDDYLFDTHVFDIEMLDDAISQEQTCTACGHTWDADYEGWTIHTDAG